MDKYMLKSDGDTFMRKILLWILCIFCLCFLILIYQSKDAVSTMKYFPVNEDIQFIDATTSLSVQEKKSHLDWRTTSTTDENLYLRQDIGLLYEDGFFKGVHNKWEEDANVIALSQTVPIKETGFFE